MTDTKFSALPELTAQPEDADELAINDAGTSKRITVQNLNRIYAKVVKPTDQSKDLDTTLADDDDLVFTPQINKMYFIQLFLFPNPSSSGGLKIAMSFPSGAVGRWLGVASSWAQWTALRLHAPAQNALGINQGGNVTVATYVKIKMSTTAGDIAFQWAQNTSHADATLMQEGSTIIVWEEV